MESIEGRHVTIEETETGFELRIVCRDGTYKKIPVSLEGLKDVVKQCEIILKHESLQ